MEIILLKDVDKVGDKHTIVTVKDGYGRNYLIPQGMAVIANPTNRKKLDDIIRKEEDMAAARVAEFRDLAAFLKDKMLKIGAKAGTSGKIFGSVTNVQIAAALKDQLDIEIERRKVVLPEDVKELGTYQAKLDLHKEVEVLVNFEVVAE
ncbi:MAG: 50S ribosomal protein L9 [Saprospiraceae bacterium]|jgi:large subunit ribosomal protein L9|nr:50S ribosomal protein L9 [Saprospiraceae bacterium]MDP4998695.1 50S ribosomal protein L9 [Saprospiraceae bacterium]